MATSFAAHGDTMDRLIQGCFRFNGAHQSDADAATAARTTTGHAHECMPVPGG
jgi:hypothetical protein